jgi:hypothetical protein
MKHPLTWNVADRCQKQAVKTGTAEGLALAGLCGTFKFWIEDAQRTGRNYMATYESLVWNHIETYAKAVGIEGA